MLSSRKCWVFGVAVSGILVLAAFAPFSSGQDRSSKTEGAKKLEARVQELEQRLFQTEKNLAEALQVIKVLQVAPKDGPPRWQMLNAGNRLVLLDTQTGESRTVEPGRAQRYQPQIVGNTLFIVDTLEGSVEERKGSK